MKITVGRKLGDQDSGLRHNSGTHHHAEAHRVPSPRAPDGPGDLYLSDCIQLFQDGILVLLGEASCQQLINLLWREERYREARLVCSGLPPGTLTGSEGYFQLGF